MLSSTFLSALTDYLNPKTSRIFGSIALPYPTEVVQGKTPKLSRAERGGWHTAAVCPVTDAFKASSPHNNSQFDRLRFPSPIPSRFLDPLRFLYSNTRSLILSDSLLAKHRFQHTRHLFHDNRRNSVYCDICKKHNLPNHSG